MAACALLESVPDPSTEEIREALSGNLCRCTGYQKILDAVHSRRPGPGMTESDSIISGQQPAPGGCWRPGQRAHRLRRRHLASGHAGGAAVAQPPWSRSDHPHRHRPGARPRGVVTVITGADLPITYGILPVSPGRARPRFGAGQVRGRAGGGGGGGGCRDRGPGPQTDRGGVRDHRGDRFHRRSGYRPGADPRRWGRQEHASHRCPRIRRRFPGVLEEADHIREDLYDFAGAPMLHWCSMPPSPPMAPTGGSPSGHRPRCQHYLHRTLEKVLELPAGRIRVVATPVGGRLQGKTDPFSHEIVAPGSRW